MYRKGSSGWSIMYGNEEFQETDIWSVYNERTTDYDLDSKSKKSNGSTSNFASRTFSNSTAARMIPRPNSNNPEIESRIPQRQSAPVNIPDWSKIYGKSKSKKSSQNSAFLDYDHDHDHHNNYDDDDDDDDDDYDDDNGNMMPPHEWIAQKLARSQISSFSVCEGAGRTLKGRDLSRVRNTVLTKTGFLE